MVGSVCIRNSLGVVYNMQGLTLGTTLAKRLLQRFGPSRLAASGTGTT